MSDFIFLVVTGIAAVSALIFGMKSCSEWAEQRPSAIAHRQQIEDDKKPRKVNEANGCEVWAFKPGEGARWMYFTRCGAKTETTNAWDECRSVQSGKTTRTVCTPHSTVITQEPK
ncbi:MAG: hypothetical protein ABT03_15530 [Comamonas sp. SCN 67-35]|uniref:hypothetical protein n=1 Tax=Comamonas sp. SCN 67-35 TaxID=1660096 RepID=UPI00086E2FF2|nr:hypothetical protein [Comamonas sp. SCN 67-35]ODU36652.1 MAG: hypothetical protein ABT03_15530 [Comamonas sp. SCN 67-35]OJV69544.1 MAG: hypothetical protein BGO35_00095 [Burkholderiales bacterium 64-34]